MRLAGAYQRGKMQSKREVAYFGSDRTGRFVNRRTCDSIKTAAGRFTTPGRINTLQRYPSLYRSVALPARPATLYRLMGRKLADDNGYHQLSAIGLHIAGPISGPAAKSKIGRILCRKNHSSSQRLLYLDLPVAWKATWSAVLQAQARVLSLLKFLAQTAQVQSLQALPLAYFATTQASTAAAKLNTTRTVFVRTDHRNRRGGYAPAAVLHFGDGI